LLHAVAPVVIEEHSFELRVGRRQTRVAYALRQRSFLPVFPQKKKKKKRGERRARTWFGARRDPATDPDIGGARQKKKTNPNAKPRGEYFNSTSTPRPALAKGHRPSFVNHLICHTAGGGGKKRRPGPKAFAPSWPRMPTSQDSAISKRTRGREDGGGNFCFY